MELPLPGRLVSVNVAVPHTKHYADASDGRTGIDKQPAAGRVMLAGDEVRGDFIGNRRVHGGRDQAVYAYAREDAAWWAGELGRELPPGAFGENMSTVDVEVTGAVVGERWRVGSALLEVSSPRIPCAVFAGFWDVRDLIKRFTARAWPGAYLRILEPGEIGADDVVDVVHRPSHGVTIGTTFRALTGDRALVPVLLDAPELPAKILTKARRLVERTPA